MKTREQKIELVNKIDELKQSVGTEAALKQMKVKKGDYYTWKSKLITKPAKQGLSVVEYSGKVGTPLKRQYQKKTDESALTLIMGSQSQILNLLREMKKP